jgi:hypothetical protein
VNEYGSYIAIRSRKGGLVAGELIAIDSTHIVVLPDPKRKIPQPCVSFPVNNVRQFTVQYAKNKNYSLTIPLYTLATLGHGFFSILTAPVNVIVTGAVTASAKNEFRYRKKQITFKELPMFARFPQGIPPNIDIASIK